jgi:hypothetical protein
MRFGRPAIDVPLSAIPVEDNPLAQRPFAKRISVSADVTLEPRARATGVEPAHLYYLRVMMPDLTTREAKTLIARGETFDDVVDLGATGCRILWHGSRYDVEDCPWRAGFRPRIGSPHALRDRRRQGPHAVAARRFRSEAAAAGWRYAGLRARARVGGVEGALRRS